MSEPPAKRRRTEVDTAAFQAVLTDLIRADAHSVFHYPVTGIDGYEAAIKTPMDFSTIQKKLTEGAYETSEVFENDIVLCFTNCMAYNPEGTWWFDQAVRVHKEFATVIFPKHGFKAETYVPYTNEADDETTMLEEEIIATRELGGEDNAEKALGEEIETLEQDSKRSLENVLSKFGDVNAIIAASSVLTTRKAQQASESSSSDEEDEEDEEEEGEEGEEGSD